MGAKPSFAVRRFVFAAVTVLILLSAGQTAFGAVDKARKPNVLFIAVDDLNAWISPLAGHPQVKTPHLDRLARRSVTFSSAHADARPGSAPDIDGRSD